MTTPAGTAGSYEITPEAAQKAAERLAQFGNEFRAVVTSLSDNISGSNAKMSGAFSASIDVATVKLSEISAAVEKTLLQMGGLVGQAAAGYSETDTFTSESVGKLQAQMDSLII
ncbi:MAG: hypothetical protein ACRCYR_11360 [Phycicoccus sp.]